MSCGHQGSVGLCSATLFQLGPRVFGAGGARGTQPGPDVSHELSVGSSEGRWDEEPGSDSDLVGVRHPLSRCRPLARSVC